LRQQLLVFKRQHRKPRLSLFDKVFWVAARQVWSDWKQSLLRRGRRLSARGITHLAV
jgi:hypothetical protein